MSKVLSIISLIFTIICIFITSVSLLFTYNTYNTNKTKIERKPMVVKPPENLLPQVRLWDDEKANLRIKRIAIRVTIISFFVYLPVRSYCIECWIFLNI